MPTMAMLLMDNDKRAMDIVVVVIINCHSSTSSLGWISCSLAVDDDLPSHTSSKIKLYIGN